MQDRSATIHRYPPYEIVKELLVAGEGFEPVTVLVLSQTPPTVGLSAHGATTWLRSRHLHITNVVHRYLCLVSKMEVREVLATYAAELMKLPSALAVPTESEAARKGERYTLTRRRGLLGYLTGR